MMSRAAGLLAGVGTLLAMLPVRWRALLVQLVDGDLDEECTETTALLMRADSIRVAFTMAYHE
jgi:hypothetical protein